jgi:hypothetical protein
MTKRMFSVRDVETVSKKLMIQKPLGYMDRRWNLALSTLVDRLASLEDIPQDYPVDTNIRQLPKKTIERRLP